MWSQSIWYVHGWIVGPEEYEALLAWVGMEKVEEALASVGIRQRRWWIAPKQMPRVVAGGRLIMSANATAEKLSASFYEAVVHVAEGFEDTGHADQRAVLKVAHILAQLAYIEQGRTSAKALIIASLGANHEVRQGGPPDYDRFQ